MLDKNFRFDQRSLAKASSRPHRPILLLAGLVVFMGGGCSRPLPPAPPHSEPSSASAPQPPSPQTAG